MKASLYFLLYVGVMLITTFLQQEFVLMPELKSISGCRISETRKHQRSQTRRIWSDREKRRLPQGGIHHLPSLRAPGSPGIFRSESRARIPNLWQAGSSAQLYSRGHPDQGKRGLHLRLTLTSPPYP